ncbi:OsmC family protein [Acidipila sp. EB88]|uniref:OsmC family protein n=1 Tax=Acidipila sp. EB88 TaxID=2305226 RepID=UPI000F5F5816|nr:OsmC family protein [Acidipila sp. EB88]RRA48678.1 OsmC family peroxiredoxin [Acidipila sp. EB88]
MKASAEWLGDTQYKGRSESNHTLLFDTDAAHTQGPSPMEAVLTALCACTSVDVVGILAKKRQPLGSLLVSAEAEQASEAPRVFTRIHVTYTVGAPQHGVMPSRKAVEDAVALSKEKYCSVSIMLQEAVEITSSIAYLDPPEDELADEASADEGGGGD